jgi:maltose phosphorylase
VDVAVVEGFGGMRVKDGVLSFNPLLPHQWQAFSFQVGFRGALLNVRVSGDGVSIKNTSDQNIAVKIYDARHTINAGSEALIKSNSAS